MKKIMSVLFITLIFLIIIPTGFAHENDTNLTVGSDDFVVESINREDVLGAGGDIYFDSSAENDGDGSQANPYKKLTADRIQSNCNIHLANGEYTLDTQKVIGEVNFYGGDANKTIIKFDGVAFKVSNSLTLNNLTLLDASIVNENKFNATNVIFDSGYGNKPDSYGNNFGGAIASLNESDSTSNIHPPTVNLNNCIFKECYAKYGGAIYIYGGSLDIFNSTFINNYAYNYGGAIAAENGTQVKISKSKFYNSKSLHDAGGAIYLRTGKLNLTSVEINNSSATFGGAITTLNATVSMNYLTARNNTAKWDGGAVYHMYGNFKSTNGTFNFNSANNGGALFIDNSTDLELNGNEFKKNVANLTAGAIYSIFNILKPTNNLEKSNHFENNKALFKNDIYESFVIDLNIGNGNYTMYKNNASDVTEIPSSYSLLDYNLVTIPKDQQSSGNCWAFTAVAVLESNILKATGEYLDFSEENIKNLISKYSDYGWNSDTNGGGHSNLPWGYLTSWLGPVADETDPFDDKGTLSPIFNSIAHVQNILFLKRDNYMDNNAIKKAILKYGAVGTGLHYDNDYLNYLTNAYYYSGSKSENHAVTIVGWDDTYSKDNFKNSSAIEGNGAWIVKNSWGPSWGDNGYFYVSYYDKFLAKPGTDESAYTFILNDTIRYDKNYQYDIAGMTNYIYSVTDKIWYKNVFNSTDNEYLAGISTYFQSITNWTASIIINGEIARNLSGTSNPGYYTFDLGDYIKLNKGDIFEVVFKNTGGKTLYIPISNDYWLNKDIFKPDVSFYSHDGDNWIDFYNVSSSYKQVACIKAFTFLNEIRNVLNLDVGYDGKIIAISAEVIDQFGNLVNHGNVTFDYGGEIVTLNLNDGMAKLYRPFSEGIKSISATFNAVGYESSSNSTILNTNKDKIDLFVDVALYLNNVNLTVTTTQPINAQLELQINNRTYSGNLNKGKYTFQFTLPKGNFQYNVSLDDYHFYGNKSGSVGIDFDSYIFIPEIDTHYVGDSFEITVLSDYPVDVKINGAKYEMNNQKVIIDTSKLNAGEYMISADMFDGDRLINTVSSTFEIIKKDSNAPTLTVPPRNVIVGQYTVFSLNMTGTESGIVIFEIGGVNYTSPIKDHVAILNVDLPIGEYDLRIFYLGDEKYNPFKTGGYSFNVVDKDYPFITIRVSGDLTVGSELVITAVADNGEAVTIAVNNQTLERNGKYTIKSEGLHTIVARTKETASYHAGINIASFAAFKKTPVVLINVSSKDNYVGSEFIIDTFTDSDSRYAVVTVNGKTINGRFTPQSAGTYVVTVTVKETDYYYESSNSTTFEVFKRPSEISVESVEMTQIESKLIEIGVPDGATGMVCVETVNNKFYTKISENKAIVNISGLRAGTYNAVVTYYGDDQFKSATAKLNIKVLPLSKVSITVALDNLKFKIGLPDDASGDVLVKINGRKVYDGSAADLPDIPINEMPVGNHILEIKYFGDDKYLANEKNVNFTLLSAKSALIANSANIEEGETLTLNVYTNVDATGIILVIIGENKYYGEIDNGKTSIIINGLSSGDYTAKITYPGDLKYSNESIEVNVKVNAKKTIDPSEIPSMKISGLNDLNVGESETITIQLPNDASGNVTVFVDGKEFDTANVNDGVSRVLISGLSAGNHSFGAVYSGDKKYASTNAFDDFAVLKLKPGVKASDVSVVEGDALSVIVEVPVDTSGFILLNVGQNKHYGEISNGKANVGVFGLTAGQYTAQVIYMGDDKYLKEFTSIKINVNAKKEPVSPNMNIKVPSDVKSGETATVTLTLPKDASGNATVNLDGVKVASVIIKNGAASLSLDKLNVGAHLVEVSYSGDDKYAPLSKSAAMSVSNQSTAKVKKNTLIAVDSTFTRMATDYFAGERGGFFYAILKDANGNVLKGKTVQIAVNGPIYNVVTDDSGRAGLQVNLMGANVYTYALAFQGDDDYNAALMASSKLTITKKPITIDASNKEFKAKAKKVLSVTLKTSKNPYDGKTYLKDGKKVTLNVGGTSYSAKIKNGVAKFTLKLTKKGKYVAKITFDGDNTYDGAKKSIKITVK